MTIVLPLLQIKTGIVAPGVAAVTGFATTVSEVAGTSAGVITAVVGVVVLVLGIARSNRDRRREYQQEIEEAERRGAERYRADMEFWRGIAVSHLINQGMPVPSPPSAPDPPAPIRRRRTDDQAGEP